MNIEDDKCFRWIYVGIDVRDPKIFKVGLTTRHYIYMRMTETTNPYYMFVRGYKVPDSYFKRYGYDLKKRSFKDNPLYHLERYIHLELEDNFPRVQHIMTNYKSEWFEGPLELGLAIINYCFAKNLDLIDQDGEYNLDEYVFDQNIELLMCNKLAKFFDQNHYLKDLRYHIALSNTVTLASTLKIPKV